jgi:hypothetical protein
MRTAKVLNHLRSIPAKSRDNLAGRPIQCLPVSEHKLESAHSVVVRASPLDGITGQNPKLLFGSFRVARFTDPPGKIPAGKQQFDQSWLIELADV